MGMRASLGEGGSQSAHPNSLKRTPSVQIWHLMSKRGYFLRFFYFRVLRFFSPLLLLLLFTYLSHLIINSFKKKRSQYILDNKNKNNKRDEKCYKHISWISSIAALILFACVCMWVIDPSSFPHSPPPPHTHNLILVIFCYLKNK
jgi:hypothetical protein